MNTNSTNLFKFHELRLLSASPPAMNHERWAMNYDP